MQSTVLNLADGTTKSLTALEISTIFAICDNEYSSAGDETSTPWSWSVANGSHAVAGALSSLHAKGIVYTDGRGRDASCGFEKNAWPAVHELLVARKAKVDAAHERMDARLEERQKAEQAEAEQLTEQTAAPAGWQEVEGGTVRSAQSVFIGAYASYVHADQRVTRLLQQIRALQAEYEKEEQLARDLSEARQEAEQAYRSELEAAGCRRSEASAAIALVRDWFK